MVFLKVLHGVKNTNLRIPQCILSCFVLYLTLKNDNNMKLMIQAVSLSLFSLQVS